MVGSLMTSAVSIEIISYGADDGSTCKLILFHVLVQTGSSRK